LRLLARPPHLAEAERDRHRPQQECYGDAEQDGKDARGTLHDVIPTPTRNRHENAQGEPF
jgi:hypothetical protein